MVKVKKGFPDSENLGRPVDQSDYLNQVRTYSVPPANFDPLRASARELARYGFPRRPNPKTEPKLAALFQKAYSRPIKPVRAVLEIDRVLIDAPRRRAIQVRDGRFSPKSWGGIITYTSSYSFKPVEPAVMVYGEWSVPTMQPDFDNPKTPMTVGFWVGLDGTINNQVLQAGTAATVTGENIDYWAWFEWFPDPPVHIKNFPISAGDLISVLVCAVSPTQGFVSMLNRTTGLTTSSGITNPTGFTSQGTAAEWVVEGISEDLPNWVLMSFHGCTAGTKNHLLDISKPTVTEISGKSKNLTVSFALKDYDTVVVLWEGYS
ncbi:MAG: A4/G1 family peptidase [Fibrobacteria bacterium]